jgi:hypothetical protein
MIRLYNAALMTAWADFNRALGLLWADEPNALNTYKEAAYGLEDEIRKSGLVVSFGTLDQFKLIRMHFEEHPGESNQGTVVAVIGRSLINIFLDDLAKHLFLSIPPNRKTLYMQNSPLFGDAVALKFGVAAEEITRAGQCLALDQWSACVFHCMRVLEHGLEPMATRFQADFGKASWHVILTSIENGLTALRGKPHKTPQEEDDITHYSEAAIQFRHFKDAWRNHAMHGRDSYDEAKAQTVFIAVRSFLQKMAEIP